MRSRSPDLLDIVEAAYNVDRSDEEWLKEVAHAAHPHLDRGFGIAAFEYFRPPEGQPSISRRFHLGIPNQLDRIYSKVFEQMDPEIRLRPFRLGPCISGSELMGMRKKFHAEPHMQRFVQRFGMYDSLWITAAEPSGHGLGLHAGRPNIAWASQVEKKRWGKIAAHLAAAIRMRHSLRARSGKHTTDIGEAVLDRRGKMLDASGNAKTAVARDQLRRAVIALEASRGPLRSADPDSSLQIRKALVRGQWTLLDHVELDGKHYIVARENPPAAPGPELLTPRERQVVAFARLGHHNKLIAYEMGIADSTVRVLLGRASAKLGVKTRKDLLRLLEEQAAPARQ